MTTQQYVLVSGYESEDGGSGWGDEIEGAYNDVAAAIKHGAEVATNAMCDDGSRIVITIYECPLRSGFDIAFYDASARDKILGYVVEFAPVVHVVFYDETEKLSAEQILTAAM
ncbi:MAG TPA: hypothetical protein VMX74_01160 [Pirellulales bacterium]|nr:hypothetical protein [Pirellulales bacterium]